MAVATLLLLLQAHRDAAIAAFSIFLFRMTPLRHNFSRLTTITQATAITR